MCLNPALGWISWCGVWSSARCLSPAGKALRLLFRACQCQASCQQELSSPQWRAICPPSAFRFLCEDIHGQNSLLLLICQSVFGISQTSPEMIDFCVWPLQGGGLAGLLIQAGEADGCGAWMFTDLVPRDLQVSRQGLWFLTCGPGDFMRKRMNIFLSWKPRSAMVKGIGAWARDPGLESQLYQLLALG